MQSFDSKQVTWHWFIEPADRAMSLLIEKRLGEAASETQKICNAIGDRWQQWGTLTSSFVMITLATVTAEERETIKLLTMQTANQNDGVDGVLFDALSSVEWLFRDPDAHPYLRPISIEEPVLFFITMFSLTSALFQVVDLPAGVTPASALVSVFQGAFERGDVPVENFF
jgi:hypothetical protein